MGLYGDECLATINLFVIVVFVSVSLYQFLSPCHVTVCQCVGHTLCSLWMPFSKASQKTARLHNHKSYHHPVLSVQVTWVHIFSLCVCVYVCLYAPSFSIVLYTRIHAYRDTCERLLSTSTFSR